ncbi:MAG: serine/threonine protein kinase [Burkholderiaceae bacterium]|jgi:serine/threonine-protein kinase|nr:serine/threonine protein kinase [Burkholderiaceae bacterium]
MPLLPVSAADWPAISALLDEALALDASARDTFLQRLDGERAQYRDTLRALLAQAAGVETEHFLATLPRLTSLTDRGATALTDLAADQAIGPYRLIRELGTGGMGAVWLAERADGALKRQVALKLPRLAWGRGLAERMARERDILASLEHPHIARLYDAGVDQHGRPYLALEYVEGQPIDDYASQRALSVRHKLDLLLQVCSAVAFAHSRLVVHRDLKPSNILVTADGQVRLLDFGIAKLMEGERTQETQLTQLAGRALTLDYASPEQIKGEPIGTASDVYSLAVVAYELLTGSKPYKLKRGSAAELEEAIAAIDSPRPSDAAGALALKRALRGDLDAIIGKALRKQAGDRYVTMSALADDLQRHLDGRPVSARPDSLLYRGSRFAMRHRTPLAAATVAVLAFVLAIGVGATALTVLVLLLGIAAAWWQAARANGAARRAQRQAERASAVTELMFDTVARLAASKSEPTSAPQSMADRVAEALAIELDAREARSGLQPAARAAVFNVASVLYNYLQRPEAVQRTALQELKYEELARESPEKMAAPRLRIALSYYWEKDYRQAIEHLDAALLVLGTQQDLDSRVLRGRALRAIGRYAHEAGDVARAYEAASRSLPEFDGLSGVTDLDAVSYGIVAMADFVTHASSADRDSEALQTLERIDSLCQRTRGLHDTVTGDVELARGRMLCNQGRPTEAAAAFAKAAVLFEKYFPAGSPTAVSNLVEKANALTDAGCIAEAAQALASAPPSGSDLLWHLASVRHALARGDIDTAAGHIASSAASASIQRRAPLAQQLHLYRSQLAVLRGDRQAALAHAEEAMRIVEDRLRGAVRTERRCALVLAARALDCGRLDDARAWLARARTGLTPAGWHAHETAACDALATAIAAGAR